MIKMKMPTQNNNRKKRSISKTLYIKAVLSLLIIISVAILLFKGIAWGASHQIIIRSVIKQTPELQLPWRIEDVKPEIIISPIAERFGTEEFTPIEEKIMEKWGYKDGVMALAIFDCGESGLDQYAVSHTGDLGIAQINWAVWGDMVQEMGRTSADLLEDVDFNLDVAYIIWDRGDGEEGNELGSWGDGKYAGWMGYNSGNYLACLR